jgi:hypothetical protein
MHADSAPHIDVPKGYENFTPVLSPEPLVITPFPLMINILPYKEKLK